MNATFTRITFITLLSCAAACGDGSSNKKSSGLGAKTDASTDAGNLPQTDAEASADARAGTSGSDGAAGSGNDQDAGDENGSKKVSIFVAQGHKGRTTISCDDGHTWIAERHMAGDDRCFSTPAIDCTHDSGSARGIAYGNGVFVAVFGWGTAPGVIARSEDGIDWEEIPQTRPFAGIAFGNDTFVAADATPLISSDGSSWSDGTPVSSPVYNVRGIGFAPQSGGKFIATLEAAERDIRTSADAVEEWLPATTRPAECVTAVNGAAASEDAIIFAGAAGLICRSADGGDTWTAQNVAPAFTSPPLWNGEEFMVWNRETLYRSTDGVTWNMETISPATAYIGPVARNDDGTFVAASGAWQAWYENQVFYRSEDGVTWEELPTTSFTGGHPIMHITAGEVPATEDCPGE